MNGLRQLWEKILSWKIDRIRLLIGRLLRVTRLSLGSLCTTMLIGSKGGLRQKRTKKKPGPFDVVTATTQQLPCAPFCFFFSRAFLTRESSSKEWRRNGAFRFEKSARCHRPTLHQVQAVQLHQGAVGQVSKKQQLWCQVVQETFNAHGTYFSRAIQLFRLPDWLCQLSETMALSKSGRGEARFESNLFYIVAIHMKLIFDMKKFL